MGWILLGALLLILAVDIVATRRMRGLYARVRRLEWEATRRRVAAGPATVVDVHLAPGTSPDVATEAMIRAIKAERERQR